MFFSFFEFIFAFFSKFVVLIKETNDVDKIFVKLMRKASVKWKN